ncbi:MAG: cyclic nucleotide-binding domain-containing protein [Betaproteobacteria bacterium]|nr:cyclic nucleotide-binding domain-containing protein [Betaproteobacteria bacterium]
MEIVETPTGAGSQAARGTCPSCTVRAFCFGHGADATALEQLDQAVERRLRVSTGEYLYRIGDPFKSLYAIRSGCLRNTIRDDRGREQVVGFHMMGDVIGVAGIGPRTYIFDMCALEQSEVCEVPFDRLEELADRVPALRGNILKIFGRYRNRDARTQSLRRNVSAQGRLAGFLLDYSRRLEALGQDPANFRLPMSRGDIASYLGLSLGALGKAFTQLEESGIAKASGKAIAVYALEGLQSLAGSSA